MAGLLAAAGLFSRKKRREGHFQDFVFSYFQKREPCWSRVSHSRKIEFWLGKAKIIISGKD
jgi:hypothetical protein